MLADAMQKSLNTQVNAEFYSAYLYLSMAAYFEALNLKGFASWMTVQAQEEVSHAMKFYHYLNERGSRVAMMAIDAPPIQWDSPLKVFEHTYEHEQKVTNMINDLVDQAASLKDHATSQMLQWFVAEQVEEESSADEIVQKIKLIEHSKGGLFMLDKELGQRVFAPPAQKE
jgi:ferritin